MVPVLVIGVVSPFSTDAYLAALPELAQDFAVTPAVAQTTLTSFVLAFAAGQLISGALSDRGHRRSLALASCVLFTAASACCVVASDIVTFDLVRGAEGLGAGAAVAATRGIVAVRSSGVALARRLGLLFTVLVVTPVIAPGVGALVITALGWRSVFVGLTLLGFVMVALVVVFLGTDAPASQRAPGGALRSTVELLRQGGFRRWLAVANAAAVGGFFYVVASPFVLQTHLHLTVTGYTVVFTSNALGLTAASLLFRRAVARHSPRTLFVVGVATSGSASAALALLTATAHPSRAVQIGLLAVAVAATGLSIPSATVLLQEAGQRSPASAGALQGATSYVTGAGSIPLLGLLGTPTVLTLATVLVASAGVQLALVLRSGRAERGG